MIEFSALKKNLKKDFSGFQKVRIALLADSSVQLLSEAIRGYGYEVGFDFEILAPEINNFRMQVLDQDRSLENFGAEIIVIFRSPQEALREFQDFDTKEQARFADRRILELSSFLDTASKRGAPRVIYANLPSGTSNVFGHYANAVEGSFEYQSKVLNVELQKLCTANRELSIFDFSALVARYGSDKLYDERLFVSSEMSLSLEALPLIARDLCNIVGAINGRAKKCLILDLDNTLWGGVIGDDGLENIELGELGVGRAYTKFQRWVRDLKRRGIILAVVSKNEEAIAKEPFEKHPDSVLRLDDLAVFIANWENKVENIRRVQEILHVGFDTMVFLDDNPVERELVRRNLPEIAVPDLPTDPALFVSFLDRENFFETATMSAEDADRTAMYQAEASRQKERVQFQSTDDFLKDLQMQAEVHGVTPFTLPRIAQLTLRTNQFNVRTKRYGEEDIDRFSKGEAHRVFAFSLRDRYGDYGLVSVVILEKQKDEYFIDTWLMSCRVFQRGMEACVFNEVARSVGGEQGGIVTGEFIPTPKNGVVKNLFEDFGFKKVNDVWRLELKDYSPRPHCIALTKT